MHGSSDAPLVQGEIASRRRTRRHPCAAAVDLRIRTEVRTKLRIARLGARTSAFAAGPPAGAMLLFLSTM
jgi:hypothetical protein